ncbi:MAG: hypothetical protein ACLPYW_04975, partial [Acidimicrobiales bacterium]
MSDLEPGTTPPEPAEAAMAPEPVEPPEPAEAAMTREPVEPPELAKPPRPARGRPQARLRGTGSEGRRRALLVGVVGVALVAVLGAGIAYPGHGVPA